MSSTVKPGVEPACISFGSIWRREIIGGKKSVFARTFERDLFCLTERKSLFWGCLGLEEGVKGEGIKRRWKVGVRR